MKKLVSNGAEPSKARVLVMGATFKEDVEDIRNSKVIDLYNELKSYGVHVDVTDPKASPAEFREEYGFDLVEATGTGYDAVVVAVNHAEYKDLDEAHFRSLMGPEGLLVDVKGVYRGRIQNLHYWSL